MFTDRQIKSLRPRDDGRPYRVYEKGSDPGFNVQVTGGGVKTFYLQYRWGGKRRFYRLAQYNGKNLADARDKARDIRALIDDGIEPQEDRDRKIAEQKAQEQAQELRRQAEERLGSVEQLFQEYMEAPSKRKPTASKRSANQVSRIYKRDIGPAIGDMKAREVAESDIEDILDAIVERGAPVLANRAHAYLKAAFNFGIRWDRAKRRRSHVQFCIAQNPVQNVEKPHGHEKPRTRVLRPEEIRECWAGWQDPRLMSRNSGAALRLILATGGQRVEEVLGAQWSELNLEAALWDIPAERVKNGRAHVVPLNAVAIEVINEVRSTRLSSPFLFPKFSDDTQPVNSDRFAAELRRYCRLAECEKFTARDLRRTAKTIMGEIRIPLELRNRIHNHAFLDVGSVHYDRHDYLAEKTEALESWARKLAELISGERKASNVTPILRAKATPN